MIFGVNTTRDISKLSNLRIRIYVYFEISLVVFMPNIITNHAVTYTCYYYYYYYYYYYGQLEQRVL